MSKAEVVRRIKAYSAASGFVYQYQFQEVRPARHGLRRGNEYAYLVSADRKRTFVVKIFVRRDALEDWSRKTGRALTGTEEYAIAKMRLFGAFDEVADPVAFPADLAVDGTNLESLLTQLDL